MNQPKRTWTPILAGAERERAMAALEEITGALVRLDEEPRPEPGSESASAGLSDGAAGRALYFAYHGRERDRPSDREHAERLLGDAVDRVGEGRVGRGFYSGLAGVGWSIAHAAGLGTDDGPGVLDDVDGFLANVIGASPWRSDYDLVSGLVGYGLYAIERGGRGAGARLLEGVIGHVSELAVRLPNGVSWYTHPALLPSVQREACPSGYYNAGLAHGTPGAIVLLAAAARAGATGARDLLEDAVRWILSLERSEEPGLRFPAWVPIGEAARSNRSSRLAWCYGDLGIAAALLAAADASDRADWAREAVRIARHAATLSGTDAAVVDTGLCHGAAGVAHVFNRLHQSTGDPVLGDAARRWFSTLFALRRPDEGFLGYVSYERGNEPSPWVARTGFLTGAAGVGLALLGAIGETEPGWDRALAISLTGRRGTLR